MPSAGKQHLCIYNEWIVMGTAILLFLSVVLCLLQYISLHHKYHFQANGRNSSGNHTIVPSCHMTSTYHAYGETALEHFLVWSNQR